MRRPSAVSRTTLLVAVAFVVLGLPDGALGVTWPSLRRELDRSVGELTWVIVGLTAGYLAMTASTGRVVRRWGTARLGGAGAAVLALALVALAAAPTWPAVLLAAALWGVGAGALDAGLNADVAIRADGRTMGMLHAGYGVGAAGGPLLAGALLSAGAGWRPTYVVIAAGCVAGVVAARRLHDSTSPAVAVPADAHMEVHPAAALVGVLTFFVYVCVELGAGHWAFTALADGRDMSTSTAARWVASYWAAMTSGRLWLGWVGHRHDIRPVLAASATGAIAGAALLVADVPAGLPLLGLGLAPIFPTLVLVTPSRVGTDRAAGVIGWQMTAAGVGGAVGPGVVGLVLDDVGLGGYGPTVLVLTVLLAVAVAATMHTTTRPAPAPT